MKLHKLTITNLNSLHGTHTIDFDQHLGSAPLFLIHGPTGAGKSTILDAICLALWGKTPRLEGGSSGTFIDDTASLSGPRATDPRRMLSHGTGEGGATLEFSIVGATRAREHYRAEWRVRRARGKADGNFQNAQCTLVRCHDGRETPASAKDVLGGMDFAQFQQLALLPQGRFAEFLRANPRERADLLERLVDASIYRRIGAAANRRRQEANDALKQITARLEGAQVLPAEERAALESELESARAAASQARATAEALRARIAWLEREHALVAQAHEATTTRNECAANVEALRPDAERLATHRSAAEARSALAARHAAAKALADAIERLDAAEAALPKAAEEEERARSAEAQTRTAHDAAAAQREALLPRIAALRQALAAATSADQELAAAVRATAAAKGQVDEADKALTTRTDHHTERTTERAAAASRAEAADTATAAWREHLPAWRAEVASFEQGVDAWHAAARAESTALAQLERARALYDEAVASLSAAEAGAAPARDRVAAVARVFAAALPDGLDASTWSDTLATRTNDAMQLRQHLAAASTTRASRATAIAEADAADAEAAQERRLAADANARAAEARARQGTLEAEGRTAAEKERGLRIVLDVFEHRGNLVPGTPCPVCGAEEHPAAIAGDDAEFEAARAMQEQAVNEAHENVLRLRNAYVDAKAAATGAEAEARAHQTNAARATERADAHRAQAEKAYDALRGLATTVGVDSSSLDDAAAWARRSDEVDQAIETNRTLRETLRPLDDALRAAERDAENVAAALGTLRAQMEERARVVADAGEQVEKAASDRAEAQSNAVAHVASLGAILAAGSVDAPSEPGEDGLALADAQRRALRTALGHLLALEEERRLAIEADARAEAALRNAVDALATATDMRKRAMDAWTEHHRAEEARRLARDVAQSTLANHRRELHEAAATDDPDAAERVAATALTDATTAWEKAQRERQKATSEHDTLRATRDARKADVPLRQAALEEAVTRWTTESARVGIDETTLAAVYLDDATVERIDRSVQAADRALAAATAVLERIGREHEEHRDARPDDIDPALAADDAADERAERLVAWRSDHETLLATERATQERVGSVAERLTADDAARARVATMQRELEEARANAALWGQMHDLIGTNNGDRFRDIAMGWAFRDIVVRASARLTTLLPRYGLRVVEDEHGIPGTELSVIDHFASDMQRPLSTLSGGETFCVSLAMALALAASRQTGVRIETLLLDEGFGTLDPDSLQLVLRALHTVQEESNAQLGLISHVQGLQEQITHRIHVRRTIGNRSEVVIA